MIYCGTVVCVRLSGRVSGLMRDREFDLEQEHDPVPVETRLQLVLAVLAHEMTVAEAARRQGVSAESINRWRNRFVGAGKAGMEDGMPGKAGSRGSLVERRQRAEIQELKLALAQATAARYYGLDKRLQTTSGRSHPC
jgi:transposase